jgi:seryl-tRNA synthetase
MVLILIAGSLNAAGIIAPEMAKRIEKVSERLSRLESEMGNLSKIESDTEAANKNLGHVENLKKLNAKKAQIETQLADTMARLENIRQDTEKILGTPEKKVVLGQQEEAAAERDAAAERLKAAQSWTDDSAAQRDKLDTDRRNAEAEAKAPKTRVLVDGADLEEFLLDLDVDSVTVRSDGLSVEKGTKVGRQEAMGEGGLLETLAVEMARPGSALHPVLLVRPGASELHDEAERWFAKWRVGFSREPVDADWEIAVR